MHSENALISRRNCLGTFAGGVFTVTAAGRLLGAGPAEEKPLFTFGCIADAQYADKATRGSRHYRNSLKKLADCVADFNKRDLAFVIHLGDFIDRDFASFDRILPVYNRLKATHYHVLGNHDYVVADDKKADVPAKLGMKSRFYSFTIDRWRFVCLDGNDVSFQASTKGTEKYNKAREMLAKVKAAKAPNAYNWNGAIGDKQMAWLRGELTAATKEKQKVIVFCHFPVYPRGAHNLWNDAQVVTLLESFPCTVAYMNGHNHSGSYGKKNGVHYQTFKGMVETATRNTYATAQVHPKHTSIDGIGREPDRHCPIRPKALALRRQAPVGKR